MPAGQCEELPAWVDRRWFCENIACDHDRTIDQPVTPHMLIPTPGGALRADLTDWIIRGVKGEVYPCKADVFEASYEPQR
jgi:hypothetical protein